MELKVVILRKLFRHRVIGGKHTAFERVMSGLPSHVLGEAKKVTEELIKIGLILKKSTSYGLQISLNPERIDEVKRILEINNR
ncbi:MAG: hypothetical protein AABX70_09160 [Nanoarchaeota archaeon]